MKATRGLNAISAAWSRSNVTSKPITGCHLYDKIANIWIEVVAVSLAPT